MRHEALIGHTVADRFVVRRFLGEGGMATVYVAEQDDEPRYVALKIMNEELTADRSFMHRFQREAQAASRVQHPNSVQIVDYGVTENISYIAMELLVGDDLYSLLERQGAIGQARAARILIEVCDVLSVAHDMGIVHRDLKPENIMVIGDPSHPSGERVKVLDFGIAKLLTDVLTEDGGEGDEQSSAVTRAGTFIGTPAYMSPEQCALLPVDTRADLYTCGVLLFQLTTGRLPFEGQTPLHTATLHIHEEPPRPSSLAPGIDPRLEAVILRALAKKPADRHQTARHLGESLRRLLPELPDTPAGTGTVSKRPIHSWGPPPSGVVHARQHGSLGGDPESDKVADSIGSAPTMIASLARTAPAPPPALHETYSDEMITRPRLTPAPPLPIAQAFDDDYEAAEDSTRTIIRPSLIEPAPHVLEALSRPLPKPEAPPAPVPPGRELWPPRIAGGSSTVDVTSLEGAPTVRPHAQAPFVPQPYQEDEPTPLRPLTPATGTSRSAAAPRSPKLEPAEPEVPLPHPSAAFPSPAAPPRPPQPRAMPQPLPPRASAPPLAGLPPAPPLAIPPPAPPPLAAPPSGVVRAAPSPFPAYSPFAGTPLAGPSVATLTSAAGGVAPAVLVSHSLFVPPASLSTVDAPDGSSGAAVGAPPLPAPTPTPQSRERPEPPPGGEAFFLAFFTATLLACVTIAVYYFAVLRRG
jgi:eukaryotic-like serine/threonine-protein kinase